jgi:hypothetical protein
MADLTGPNPNPFAEDIEAAVASLPEAPPFVLRIVTAAESARGPYRGIGRFGSHTKYPRPPLSLCSASAGAFRRHPEAPRGEPRQGSGSPHDTGGPEGRQPIARNRRQTRKWTDQAGQERYTTEVVIGRFRGELTMLSSSGGEGTDRDRGTAPASAPAGGDLDDDDDIRSDPAKGPET